MAKCLKTNELVIITLSAYWVKCLSRHGCPSAELIYSSTLSSPNFRRQRPKEKIQKMADCKTESQVAHRNSLKYIIPVDLKCSTYIVRYINNPLKWRKTSSETYHL